MSTSLNLSSFRALYSSKALRSDRRSSCLSGASAFLVSFSRPSLVAKLHTSRSVSLRFLWVFAAIMYTQNRLRRLYAFYISFVLKIDVSVSRVFAVFVQLKKLSSVNFSSEKLTLFSNWIWLKCFYDLMSMTSAASLWSFMLTTYCDVVTLICIFSFRFKNLETFVMTSSS